MKLCMACGMAAQDEELTCQACGEASWGTDKVAAKAPEPKPAKAPKFKVEESE